MESGVGQQSWPREHGSWSMLPELLFCAKKIVRVIVEVVVRVQSCRQRWLSSPELVIGVDCAKVVIRICHWGVVKVVADR